MYNTNFENAYAELAKIWDKYPDIKKRYLNNEGYDEENIELFIANNYSDCFYDEMEKVFERYYGENYDVPGDENREFYNRYFGIYWYNDIYEQDEPEADT